MIYFCPLVIRILWNTAVISNFIKYLTFEILFKISLIKGKRY